jgi:AcrR family transcriptional regulator/transposase-like protein
MRIQCAPPDVAPTRDPREDECLDWLWRRRYSVNGREAECPQCGLVRRFHRIRTRRSYACAHCGHQLFPTAGTLFGRSSTPLSIWLGVAYLLMNESDGVSAREIQRRFRLEYRTALRIKHRLLDALVDPQQQDLLNDAVVQLSTAYSPSIALPGDPYTREKMNAIRAAACRVFAQHGFAHARIADIAAECGESSAVVRYHFGTKDELLRAALAWTQERGAQRLHELMQRERDPRRRLDALLDLALPTTTEIGDEYLLWLDAWARARGGRRFDEDEVFSGWHQTVVEVVREGQAAGVFALAHSPEDFGDAFVALVDGLSFKVIERYEEMPLARARELLGQWVADQLALRPESG